MLRLKSVAMFALGMLLLCGPAFSDSQTPSTPVPDATVCFSIREAGSIALAMERCLVTVKEAQAARVQIDAMRKTWPSRLHFDVGCTAGISVINGGFDTVCGASLGFRIGK